jgi:hypothetical protein
VSDFDLVEDEYRLQPEAIQSFYVMWKITSLQKYQEDLQG